MPDRFEWSVPPLNSADEMLAEAYKTLGRSLDDLPYTPEFERLVQLLEVEDSTEARHLLYRRLMNLRKSGRLPRVGWRNPLD
jgi:hypothetical protein